MRSTSCQKASSSSLLVLLNFTLPTIGSSAGAVITTLPRGYWKTAPPSESCSSVTNFHVLRHGHERRGESRRPGADNDEVEHVRVGVLLDALGDVLDGAAPLFERIADQAHAAQLAGDEDARHAGFEFG